MDSRLNSAFWTLRIAFGLTAFLAGLDKYFNLLTNWEKYVSPLASNIMAPATLMHIAGAIEIVVGLAVLAGVTRIGGYVVTVWLALIAINLLTTGQYFDVAVRDLVMACGAFTLARLAEVREGAAVLHPMHGATAAARG